MRARVLYVVCASALAVVACAELFDEPSQCKTDRDCEKFGPDAVCFVAQAVCISRSGGADDAGLDASATDASVDNDVPQRDCRGDGGPKPVKPIPTNLTDASAGDITTSVTLDCDNDWTLDRRVYVHPGATLTIHENTTIRATAGARLVIMRGARIQAVGRRDMPIVFTSGVAGVPAAGNWDGIYVLGNAPPARATPGQNYNAEALLAAGGNDAADNSGALEFVRIEYSGEGLVLSGVGRGTRVDHVQVRRSGDNCFTLFGGTVGAKHLVCQFPTDEQFEIDGAFTGKLQFIFGQKTPTGANVTGRNGVLTNGSTAAVYNATIIGDSVPVQGYGLVFRNGSGMDYGNFIIQGWHTGIEAIGGRGTPLDLRGSLVFGNTTNPTYEEDAGETDAASPFFDDDGAFDELGFFSMAGRNNATNNPTLISPFNATTPEPWPSTAITTGAATPPAGDGFFDVTATYIGAFKDSNDAWTLGWTRFGN